MKLSPSERAWTDKVLRAIAAVEAGPSEADLANAPVLSDWKAAVSPHGHMVMWGDVADHPILGTEPITTSQLVAIHPEAGWARTASRWYRLGRPISAFEAKVAESMGGEAAPAGSISVTIPGFTSIDDPALLARLLARYIVRVREIDAADRAASEEEE